MDNVFERSLGSSIAVLYLDRVFCASGPHKSIPHVHIEPIPSSLHTRLLSPVVVSSPPPLSHRRCGSIDADQPDSLAFALCCAAQSARDE